MKRLLQWLICGLFVGSTSLIATSAAAYPDRPVRIVVPYPAGGGVDLIARGLANKLSQRWGHPIVVDNRPGGSSNIGASVVARSPRDGYVLLLTTDATITSNPHMFRNMPFDPMRDFVPLSHIVNLNFIVAANPKVPASTLAELLALAKTAPGHLNFSSSGNGSQAHLMFGALSRLHGVQIVHIPYSGIAPALQAALSGEVQVTLAGGTSAGLVQSGMLRPLAVAGENRLEALPNIPTLREAGFLEVDPRGWVGLFAPAGVPTETMEKIESDVQAVLADAEFQRTVLQNIAFSVPADASSRAFNRFLQEDFEFKRRLIEAAGVQLD